MTDGTRSLELNTGASMPFVGLGTWKSQLEDVGSAIESALIESGYRHIDCASIYRNEKEIGMALSSVFGKKILRRKEVFITSKLWNTDHGRVRAACEATLKDLRVDYLDLYLMHWGVATPPGAAEPLDESGFLMTDNVSIQATWKEMEKLAADGLVKAIGVANFTAPMLLDLFSYAEVPPAVNQIELHPYLQQQRLVDFCHHKGIVVTAYSPLGRPSTTDRPRSSHLIDDAVVARIAAAHGKSPAQVLIRWAIQRRTAVIPKSTHPKRIRENIDVFNFELSPEEMSEMQALERGLRIVEPYDWWKVPYFG